MQLSNIIKHIRQEYMSGVERTKDRVRSTGEVFTPSSLVMKYVNWLDETYPDAFNDINNTFGDNSCGDAQFLGEILIRKLEKVSIDDIITDEQFKDALSSIHGIDFQISNIDKARERLLCNREEKVFKDIVEKNIVCTDALRSHYRFDGTPCDVVETKEEKSARIKKERDTVKKQKEREKLAKKKQRETDRAKSKAKKEREKLKKQAKAAAEKLNKALQREREKAERLAKKEEARIEREKSKSKLTILDPDLFEF